MKNNRRQAQVDRAISYMREHGSLTSLEALTELGILSFPKRICEMKKQGFYIKTKWESGEGRNGKYRVKRYFLIEEPKEIAE
jgi:hypothetical protein